MTEAREDLGKHTFGKIRDLGDKLSGEEMELLGRKWKCWKGRNAEVEEGRVPVTVGGGSLGKQQLDLVSRKQSLNSLWLTMVEEVRTQLLLEVASLGRQPGSQSAGTDGNLPSVEKREN